MSYAVRVREQHAALGQRVDIRIAIKLVHDLRIAVIFLDHHYNMVRAGQLLGVHSGHE
jgi:hypothetical protein